MEATAKAPPIATLRPLDSCVTLGRTVRAGTPACVSADDVLTVLDRYDIAEALVHDVEARLTRPRSLGNGRVLGLAARSSRLHPVWVLEPPERAGREEARALVGEMLEAGVRAARLMMGVAPPLVWLWGDLLEALQDHRVPCLLDFARPEPSGSAGSTQGMPDDWAVDGLRELCLAFPDLPMVLSHVSGGLGLPYATLPLMRRAGNLHIDVTGVVDYWRKVAVELGPERVVFATGMPFYDPATFISNVQDAHEIDEAGKRLICGDNMRRLMAAVR